MTLKRNEIQKLLESSEKGSIEKRIAELEKEGRDDAGKIFLTEKRKRLNHDSLIDICISAFSPQSLIYNKLGYSFITTEPLIELGVKNFDLLIFHKRKKHAIFNECKIGTHNPSRYIGEIYQAIDEIKKNQDYLQEAIGDEIKTSEFVLCAPSEVMNTIVRVLVSKEQSGEITSSDDRILLWQVNKFVGQSLALFPHISSRDKLHERGHADSKLTSILSQGVKVDKSEVLYKGYPSSHPLRLIKEVLINNLSYNYSNDLPIQVLSKKIIYSFFTNSINIPHYNIAEIGKKIASNFIDEGLEMKLLKVNTEDLGLLDIQVSGKTINTIISNYEKKYSEYHISKIAVRNAEKKTVEEYQKRQSKLNGFE